jgi:hypothetical protein
LSGRKLQAVFRWNDPDRLTHDCIQDLAEASHGVARFEVAERFELDEFPVKADGFRYQADDFAARWRARQGFHQPDAVDYYALIRQFGLLEKVRSRQIDEAWLMAFPYAGYYESIMAGPDPFWCNAPPLQGTEPAERRFVIMGFNYERGVGEMLESFGHRTESILAHVFRHNRGPTNLWERFIRHERSHPGQAEVGNIHFAPNSMGDYDWGNRRPVSSACDDWYGFPGLTGARRTVDCREWGGGDIRAHHTWWYRHLPHVVGESQGVLNNWWAYVLDPDRVR